MSTDEVAVVLPCDREAAANSSPYNDRWGELARTGHVDSDPLILAFARHREQAVREERERAVVVAQDHAAEHTHYRRNRPADETSYHLGAEQVSLSIAAAIRGTQP